MREIIKKWDFWHWSEKGTTVIFQTHEWSLWGFSVSKSRYQPIQEKILDGTIKQVKSSFRPEVYSITIDHLIQIDPAEWAAKQDDSSFHFYPLPILSGKKPPNQLFTTLMGICGKIHAVPRQ